MTHALYVASAYGISALTLAGLLVWMIADQRLRRREFERLEAGGGRRRSRGAETTKMSVETAPLKNRRRLLALLPLLVFAALAGVFLLQLLSGRDSATMPSALLGEQAPQTDLPPLDGSTLPGLASGDFSGEVTLVNVWASWCAPCRQEHPVLTALGEDGRIRLAGLNYKDKPQQALGFLEQLGNPFDAIGLDASGRTAIDWGVYGVPETFLVGRDGKIMFKHVGPLTPEIVAASLVPEIEKALASGG